MQKTGTSINPPPPEPGIVGGGGGCEGGWARPKNREKIQPHEVCNNNMGDYKIYLDTIFKTRRFLASFLFNFLWGKLFFN